MDSEVTRIYGNKVRMRVCGICLQDEKILLVNHARLGPANFWAPPGGGLEFGQSLEENLEREFLEETGLIVKTGRFMFGCEFLSDLLHSVELFFEVTATGGNLKTGFDPELQLIKDVRFIPFEDVKQLSERELHGVFKNVPHIRALLELKGFYRI